jgi:hypothetical protein
MTTSTGNGPWEHIGRAAEHFGRRVACDARRFAARVEEHVGEFAHDVERDSRCRERRARHDRPNSGEDVRRVFDDVRTVLASVLDGVDEFITKVFPHDSAPAWTRVVLNREATCSACARPLVAGSEGLVHPTETSKEFRCLECGVPTP